MRDRSRALAVLLPLIAAAAIALQITGQAPALAHAEVALADPAPNSVLHEPPDRVAVWFTEPVEPGLSELRVLDSRGSRVDDGGALFDRNDETATSVGLRPIPNGLYTVAWKNVSKVDGHLVRGSFLFSLGEPLSGVRLEPTDKPLFNFAAEPVLRWLTLLSALAMAGGPVFELLVSRPVLFRREAHESVRRLGAALESRSTLVVGISAVIFVASSFVHLLFQAGQTHDVPPLSSLAGPAWSVIAETSWGRAWSWRVLAALGLAISLALTYVLARRSEGAAQPGACPLAGRLAVLAFGGGILWMISMTSHGAATAGIRASSLFADYLHLVATAFWVGALFHFALSVPIVFRDPALPQRMQCLAALAPRFSSVAFLSVAVLIVTGVFGAWAQVNTPPALATPYGVALVAKVLLVIPLLFLGALNLV